MVNKKYLIDQQWFKIRPQLIKIGEIQTLLTTMTIPSHFCIFRL